MRTSVIPFYSENRIFCCAYSLSVNDNWHDFELEYSSEEIQRIMDISSPLRKQHYALGRVAAKRSIVTLLGEKISYSDITVSNHPNGAPKTSVANIDVSISHADQFVAAIAYPDLFSIGIDIEFFRDKNINALQKITNTVTENVPPNIEDMTQAWAMKEAMGKAIKTGFSIGFDKLRFSSYLSNNCVSVCKFLHYPDYIGISVKKNDAVFAIAYEKKCKFNFDASNFLKI